MRRKTVTRGTTAWCIGIAKILLFMMSVLLIGCTQSRFVEENNAIPGNLVDATVYSKPASTYFSPVTEAQVGSVFQEMQVGDVTGGPEPEILLHLNGTTNIYSTTGALIQKIEIEGLKSRLGFLADIDRDGKKDIILGGKDDSGARIIVMNGRGDVIIDETFVSMIQGHTYPQYFSGGRIFFTAYSARKIAPKIVGAFDPGSRTLDWAYHMGPAPVSLSPSADSKHVIVSNQALDREWPEVQIPYASSHERHGLFLLDSGGEELLYHSVGPVVKHGYPTEGQISSLFTRLVDADGDGEDEILCIHEHLSEVYGGPSRIEVREPDSSVIAEREGPAGTDVSVGWYHDGGDLRIVLAWGRLGLVQVVDGALKLLHEVRLDGTSHETKVRSIMDMDADGSPEILVTDHNRMTVYTQDLKPVSSYRTAARIMNAHTFGAEGTIRIALLSDRLTILQPSEEEAAYLEIHSRPPGARIELDEKNLSAESLPVVSGVQPGKHTLTAIFPDGTRVTESVTLQAGSAPSILLQHPAPPTEEPEPKKTFHDTRVASLVTPERPIDGYGSLRRLDHIELPEDYHLLAVEDLLGDSKPEYLLTKRRTSKDRLYDFTVWNREQEILSTFTVPIVGQVFTIFGDIDGDDKTDICLTEQDDNQVLSVYNGEGGLLLRRPFLRTNEMDSNMQFMGWFGDHMMLYVITGYMLSPRGYYAYDPAGDHIDWFHPTAGFSAGFTTTDDRILLYYYTPGNGAAVTHPDGTVETDSFDFLHIVDREGNLLPGSGPLTDPPEKGGLTPFVVETEGGTEIHIADHKSEHYPGTGKIFRLHDDGTREPVFSGIENNGVIVHGTFTHLGKPYIAFLWQRTKELILLDHEFREIKSWDLSENWALFKPVDLDADGAVEFLFQRQDTITITDWAGNILKTMELPEDTIINLIIKDLDEDGAPEFVVIGLETVEVWGY